MIVHVHYNKRLFYGYLKITELNHENSSKDIRISALSNIYQGFGHWFYFIFIYFSLQFPITILFFFKTHLFDVHFFTKIFLCLIISSKEQILSLNKTYTWIYFFLFVFLFSLVSSKLLTKHISCTTLVLGMFKMK